MSVFLFALLGRSMTKTEFRILPQENNQSRFRIKSLVDVRGFSLVETMLYLLISALAVSLVAGSAPRFWQLNLDYLNKGKYKEALMLFLNQFEKEFNLAVKDNANSSQDIADLVWKMDRNFDLDHADGWEKIAYKYDPDKKWLTRKSGAGNFNRVLVNVKKFSWQPAALHPDCFQLEIQSIFETHPMSLLYCPH